MKRKILASLLGAFMLCGLPAQVLADGEGEDLSEYDIDLDLTEDHAYEFRYSRDTIEVHAFDNEGNACAATAGIISGGSFLSVKPKSLINTTQIQVALKEPEQPCRLLAGTYDVYVVMAPDYYKAPEEEPEVKAKTKMSATLFYHNSMADQRPVHAERYDFEYNGEKVDTVLLYEGLDIPTSYYGFRDFFPYLQLASRKASLTEQRNGYIHAFSVDRVILKARSITDREPVTVYTGTCGENATYSLDITTGLLTISGTGTLTAAPLLASPLWSCVKKIAIENGITAIGPKVFQHIGFPTTLPETLQAIGDSAFYWSPIRDIKLPEGLQTIGKDAFALCDSLSSVSFPSTLQSIGDRAFFRTNVKEIEIPVNMKTLGNDVFANCSLNTVYWNAADCRYDAGTHPFLSVKGGIRSFHIGEQVRHIPACLCSGMGGLEDFSMGENVETIGDSAFFSFRPWLLDSIDIPATTTSIAENAFVNADLAAINVAAGNKAYCDVDGILFSKDLTSLVYYPKYANRSMRYTVPSTVKSLGECAFVNYLPSSLVLPWADAESIPLAAPTTFRNDIVFYVPNEALGDYQSLSPYSSHDIITRANLAWYMAESERFSVFNKLLVATGWADALKAERDEEYERLYAEGKLSSAPDLNSYTRTEGYPSERKYGFTILAETDSVYEAMTGLKAADITAESVAKAIESMGVQGGVNSKDYTAADNALNRFVSYHLLNVALPADRLVKHGNTYGYDPENPDSLGVSVTDYYETLGGGRRLVKLSESEKTGGVRINRYVKMNPKTGMDAPEATDGFIPGIRLERDGRRVINGYVYAITEPLAYTDETAEKVLGRERMRHDIAALLPELENNDIRLSKNHVFCPGSEYAYFENLETLGETYTYYLSGVNSNWLNYQEDELDFSGQSDIIIKLPAVPVSGVYELRLGTQSYTSRRGVYQFLLGKDKANLSTCGLPVDMRECVEDFGEAADTQIEMLDRMADLQLREKGVMKAPQSIYVKNYSGKTLRENRYAKRHIIGRVALQAGETYYLRIFDCSPNPYNAELYLDYLEWVPKIIYANPNEVEDIW